MVEALQCVLWKILHLQQADGLRVGGAVHQGNTLQQLQCQGISSESKGATHSFSFMISEDRRDHEQDGVYNTIVF